MTAWTERAASRAGLLEIVVDAIDVVRTEKSEMDRFRDALSAPPVDKPVREGTSLELARRIAGAVYLLLNLFLTGVLLIANGTLGVKGLGAGGLLFLAIAGFLAFRRSSSRRSTSVPVVRDRFTITLDDFGLVVAGTDTRRSYPLETIERFEGAKERLVVLSRDGSRAELPLALASLPENQALAGRRLSRARTKDRRHAGAVRR